MLKVVLDTNVVVSADYIISGDQHLLQLKEFQGIKILTPSEFVALLHVLEPR